MFSRIVFATFAALALLVTGCSKPTSDAIQLWKTTEKGPGKLRETLADKSIEPKLRAEAGVALIDIDKGAEVDGALTQMPATERWEVFKTLLPLEIAAMTASQDSAPQKSLAYRDALFSARGLAQPEDQAKIDTALLPGIEQDLRRGRVRSGSHSVDKILTAVGPAAGVMLAKLLAEPIVQYGPIADLLARVGDESARQKGAASLLERARRDRPISDQMWKALGVLGGPLVVAFLQEKVSTGAKEEANAAVRALQQRREPAVLTFALKVAGDPKGDRAIRDEMFGVVETIGGLQARDGLVRIIQSDKDELVRYRAFESLLAVAKQEGIAPGLEAFPASAPYKKVDVEDLLVKLINKLGAAARPVLVKVLESKYALARMTAVLSLEDIGKAADAPALDHVSKDSATVKGFPAGETVGKQAIRVAGVLRSKG